MDIHRSLGVTTLVMLMQAHRVADAAPKVAPQTASDTIGSDDSGRADAAHALEVPAGRKRATGRRGQPHEFGDGVPR